MKKVFPIIIVTVFCTVIGTSCTKSASMPQPAPGKSVVDSFDVKLWPRPIVTTATL